jgi:thiosulfate/3-mercaptopyruvate sulfurtransferase
MKLIVLTVLIVSGNAPLPGAADTPYPQPNLVVEPAELGRPEVARRFLVLDARDRKKYDQGQIPNARWVDHDAWAKAFADGTDTAGWSKRLALLGVRPDQRVVVYDDNATKEAARIWWILRYWGIENVRLLNGGWTAWRSANFPVQTAAPPAPAPTTLNLKPRPDRLATKALLLESLKGNRMQIVDARSEAEHCGTQKLAKRGGAIPGARHLEWVDVIDKDTQRFKSPEELRRLFDKVGIDLSKPTTTYCQSGGRAAVMDFALELMGAKEVRNYYKSWAEWGNAEETPAVSGKAKK